MVSNKLAEKTALDPKIMESVLVSGDLSSLSTGQRLSFYKNVCESLGLNPLTKPFGYIQLNGKLTIYALRDCTDQIRSNRGVSISKLEAKVEDGVFIVTAYGQDKTGRTDCATGAVDIKSLMGEKKANAIMKAETKAKRRLTLSLCGLGWIDESEVSSIPDAKVVEVDAKMTTTETVNTKLDPTDTRTPAEIVGALPNAIKKLMHAAGVNTPERAYEVYQACGGDIDAIKQWVEEQLKKAPAKAE